MFGTIRKHQTWLWAVIVTVTIISFVSFFNPSSRSGGARSGAVDFGTIDGRPITEEDYGNAQREANLHFFMSYGSWPDADAKRVGFDAERETYSRLFFIAKLKQNNIQVDSDSAARMANTILLSLGRGTPVPLSAFVEQVLTPHGLTANDFQRYCRHDLGIQQLVSTIGVAGKLITPAEAQDLYIRERQEISATAVFFTASNYLASAGTLSPEVVGQFYTNQMAMYRTPERMQVSYVQFDVTNFMVDADEQIAKMTNFNGIVDQVYLQRGTNYYKGTTTADQAKTKIRSEIRHEFATTAARKKANDFATDLYNQQPQLPKNLAALATEKGLAAKVSTPFSKDFPPDEVGILKGFTEAAFALADDAPFAGPLTGTDAVYVITTNRRIPSTIPPLAEIRSQVQTDAQYNQAGMMARSQGLQFAHAATNGLAAGKTFAGICTDAKVKPTVLPPFSLNTRELPEVEGLLELNQLKQVVFDTQPGKVSNFYPTRLGGVVVYVQQQLPVDEAKMRAEMPEFVKAVRQQRQNEAVNFWYRREAEKSLRDTFIQKRASSLAAQAKQ